MPAIAFFAVATAAVVMAGALAYGAAAGDLWAEGGALVDMPWGLVTLVEVYVGLTLFACWVLWREASRLEAAAWLVAAALGGNIVSCAYVLLALRRSRGDAEAFWMGARAPTRTAPR
jgi:hypothetical protein